MRNDIIFGSHRVVSPSNRAMYITSIGWVYSLNLGAVLVYLSLSPPTGYASSPHGASVDASCVTEMSQFCISSLCFLYSVTIRHYALFRRKLKPE